MSFLIKQWKSQQLFDSEFLLLSFVLLMMTAGFVSIAISQICLGASLGLLLYRWWVKGIKPPKTGLETSALLLAVWALVNIFFSTDWQTSLIFYRRFFLFSAIWVVAAVITTERRRILFLIFSMVGALGISIYGEISQIVRFGSIFERRFDSMSNSMTSGSLLMMFLLIGAGFLLAGGLRRRTQVYLLVGLIPVFLGVILTLTRSALLGLIVGVALMLLLSHRRWFFFFLGLLGLGVLLLVTVGDSILPPLIYKRLSFDYLMSGTNTVVRLEMWQGGWEMVKDRPILGMGDRSLDTVGPDYFGNAETVYHGHMHNNFVQLAVIWGIPGLILGLFFIFQPIFLLVPRWNKVRKLNPSPQALSGWILGACGLWVGFVIAGLTEWYFGDAETMLIYLAFLGCAMVSFGSIGKKQNN